MYFFLDWTVQLILAAVIASLTGATGYIFYRFKKWEELNEVSESRRVKDILIIDAAINESLRALCRDRILQGYRYYKSQGGITTQDLETMTKLYNAYHDLGGNGTMTAVFKKIISLPIKEGI